MRKIGMAALLLSLVSFGFYSCSSDDDTEWRDNNLAFFDGLAKISDLHVIGDSVNSYPGIYYQVLKEGTGTIPVIGNVVKTTYAGWMWNDTIKYNSTLSLDDAFNYNMSGKYTCTVGKDIIDGWSLALQKMPVGSKWRIFIPYYLGYGSSGSTSGSISVRKYSTLIFDIKLLEITSEN
jgi:FKBP-type peptidyl-prolyl cis-trans isomerase